MVSLGGTNLQKGKNFSPSGLAEERLGTDYTMQQSSSGVKGLQESESDLTSTENLELNSELTEIFKQ